MSAYANQTYRLFGPIAASIHRFFADIPKQKFVRRRGWHALNEEPQTTIRSEAKALRRSGYNPAATAFHSVRVRSVRVNAK
jgi:hypothetical protein